MNEILKGAKFHHIALATHRYNETIAFYKSLGFTVFAQWETPDKHISMLKIGDGGIFEIFSDGKDIPEENPKYFHLAIAVDDPDFAYALALKAGASSKMEPSSVTIPSSPPMKVRLAFVYGLNGEVLEFFRHDD